MHTIAPPRRLSGSLRLSPVLLALGKRRVHDDEDHNACMCHKSEIIMHNPVTPLPGQDVPQVGLSLFVSISWDVFWAVYPSSMTVHHLHSLATTSTISPFPRDGSKNGSYGVQGATPGASCR